MKIVTYVKSFFTAPKQLDELREELSRQKQSKQKLLERVYVIESNLSRLTSLEDKLADLTNVHIDVNMKEPTQVVFIGRYRGHDVVKIYTLPDEKESITSILNHLEAISLPKTLGRIDAIQSVSAIVKNEARISKRKNRFLELQ